MAGVPSPESCPQVARRNAGSHEPVSEIAARVYVERQRRARQVVADGGMQPAEARRHLLPWLRAALVCGADIEALELFGDDLDALRESFIALRIKRPDGTHAHSEHTIRRLIGEDICPRVTMGNVLIRAFASAPNDPARRDLRAMAGALAIDLPPISGLARAGRAASAPRAA